MRGNMKIIDFIKEFNEFTKIVLEWYWVDEGIDEEYSFEGSPSEFIEKYTRDYDCIDGFDIFDVHEMKIINEGIRSKIYIEIVRE